MKKKVFFMVSSVLMILISVLAICMINQIIDVQMPQYEALAAQSPAFQKVVDLAKNGNLKIVYIVLSAIHILLGVFIFRCAQKNLILVKKGKIIAASVFCMFSNIVTYTSILAIINIIVLLFCKRTNPEDYPSKEKLPLPENETVPLKKSEIMIAILLVFIYASEMVLDKIIPSSLSDTALSAIAISFYAVLFILAIACLATIFKKDIVLFFKNNKAYLQRTLPLMGLMYVTYFIVIMILINIIKDITSVNQGLLEDLPLYISAPLAIIWAPIVEEVIFRGILHKLIKNDTLFIISSGLIFGIMHTAAEATLVQVLSLSLPYVTLGLFLALIYTKTKNISNNIFAHAIHNTIGMLVLALSKV